MKKFTKLLGIVLIIALVMSMGTMALAEQNDTEPAGDGNDTPAASTTTVPTSQTIAADSAANADGKYTISVASGDTHTYTVYQILTGTLIAGQSKLGNPAWGADAKGGENNSVNDFITAITADGLSNMAINDLVEAQLATNATGRGTINKTTSLDVVPGYYLIVDTTENLPEGDAYSLNIVAVFNDITISPKKGTTESEKHVDDQNDSNTSDHSELKDSADYDIGDTISYTLTMKLPEDYANYDKYYVQFVDDMSKGLTYNGDAKIYYGATDTAGTAIGFAADSTATSDYTGGTVYKATISDLKTTATSLKAGDVITIKYTATLNENAFVGVAGNPNRYQVIYSNNPNDTGEGKTGNTPWDKNIVFTYKTVFNKVDTDQKPLTGADFTLYKKVINDSEAGFEWVNVTALHTGDNAKNPSKTVENLTTDKGTAANAKFTFTGLDAGDYKLEETTTPAGYNTINPIEFTISATHELESNDPALTALTGADNKATHEFEMTAVKEGTGDDAKLTGELDADIVNGQGSVLPSTGGIGTTIFYVVGSILVVAAGVLLITKKRMSREG